MFCTYTCGSVPATEAFASMRFTSTEVGAVLSSPRMTKSSRVPFLDALAAGAFTDEATLEETAADEELAAGAAESSFARPALYVRN